MEPTPSPGATVAAAEAELAAEERRYAGWGQRLAAYIVDFVILLVVIAVPAFIVGAIAAAGGDTAQEEDAGVGLGVLVWYGLGILLPAIYFTVFHGRDRGQTPGKMLLGIRVEDDERRRSIGYGRAFLRWLVPGLFGIVVIPWLLDYLWPLWDKKKQSWHDKIVGSVVVRA